MLKGEQNKILAILKDNKDKGGSGMPINGLANHLDIPLSELEYCLDALRRNKYIREDITDCYQITPLGTGYLLEKGDNE